MPDTATTLTFLGVIAVIPLAIVAIPELPRLLKRFAWASLIIIAVIAFVVYAADWKSMAPTWIKRDDGSASTPSSSLSPSETKLQSPPVGPVKAEASLTPLSTPTPTPAPTLTPTPTPTPTPTATPTPTPTPRPTPTPPAPPKASPNRLDSTGGTEKSPPKNVSRFKLGPIFIDVDGVKNARSDLQVYVTITNQSDRVVYVFAGSPDPIGASWRQMVNGAQALTGRGSDNKNSTFWLKSVEGFTRSSERYFQGENIYIELAPKESANASFLLANNWLTGPELGNVVHVAIEFAIVTDLRAKGSHQTRALTLTNWPLD